MKVLGGILGVVGSLATAQAADNDIRAFTAPWHLEAPLAPYLWSMATSPGGASIVAVGQDGTILWSDDKGGSWSQPIAVPQSLPSLWGVTCQNDLDCIAVGDRATVLRSSDGGRRWHVSPVRSAGSKSLYAVAFSDGLHGVAVGDGIALWTSDGGQIWSPSRLPAGVGILRAAAFGPSGKLITVGDSGAILISADGGHTLDPPTKTPEMARANFRSLSFADADHVVAVAEDASAFALADKQQIGNIVTSEDGGQSWRWADMKVRVAANLYSVVFTSDSHGVAVGDSNFADINAEGRISGGHGPGPNVFISDDSGQTWTPAVSSYQGRLYAVGFMDKSRGIAVGKRGSVITTRDGGMTWQTLARNSRVEAELGTLVVVDSGNAVVAGQAATFETWDDTHADIQTASIPDGMVSDLVYGALSGPKNLFAIDGEGRGLWSVDGGQHLAKSTIPAGDRLAKVAFGDPRVGAAITTSGNLRWSNDGGREWHEAPTLADFQADDLSFVDETDVVVVGRTPDSKLAVATSANGGKAWAKQDLGSVADGPAIMLSHHRSPRTAIFAEGIFLSDDRGQTWRSIPGPDGSIGGAHFVGGSNWIATQQQQVVVSGDDGQHWIPAILPAHLQPYLGSMVFSTDEKHGLATAGDDLLWTEDAGRNWSFAEMPSSNGRLVDMALVGANAVAAGADGSVLESRDYGRSWAFASVDVAVDDLRNHVLTKGRSDTYPEFRPAIQQVVAGDGEAVAIGRDGLRIKLGQRNYAAMIQLDTVTLNQSVDGGVEVAFRANDPDGPPDFTSQQPLRVKAIEFSVQRPDRPVLWESIKHETVTRDSDGTWRAEWNPGAEMIANGAQISFRATLDDGGPSTLPQVLGTINYRPFLDRLFAQFAYVIWPAIGLLGIVALYLIPIGAVYCLEPARLAKGRSGFVGEVDDAVKTNGTALSKLAAVLMSHYVLLWFKLRPRVRDAWLVRYVAREAKFKELAPEVRDQFLGDEKVLDAWVERRLKLSQDAMAELAVYKNRRIYIPFPLIVGDVADGARIKEPQSADIAAFFSGDRAIVSIVAGGGGGKTTLACAIARWAGEVAPERRLMKNPAIPLIITDDFTDLEAAVTAALRKAVGDDEVDDDIVQALLRRKRVVVIVDALSERPEATQKHVEQLYGTATPINALIITTRHEIALGGAYHTVLRPQPITLSLLVPFITEYLQRRSLTDRFEARQQLALADRIVAIVEHGGASKTKALKVTPLLITLFVDAAVARVADSGNIESLPVNVPEVYLDYLDRLNPVATMPARADRDVLDQAAFILAKCSLETKFVPGDFLREAALVALTSADLPHSCIDTLIVNGVILAHEAASVGFLRFQLDPIAEYLAAIAVCRDCGSSAALWGKLFDTLGGVKGYPGSIQGYLTAISICYASYLEPLKLAAVEIPWETAARLNIPTTRQVDFNFTGQF
ncbi:hypothetical protein LB516_03460 [Mesorhizobium sp. CO1-1-7]|uniref:YCF48-related protein n=1 Tax=Mesorhizobium sp. CO1-1-7 TaxID=2876632 RepID=UPI001CD16B00|nr:hypothetical protein [Mesorhizobium sp. CO1-1-7]MBZ9744301.1 hypothetical protein [Mesorhizobium sp. CO1-1-7]